MRGKSLILLILFLAISSWTLAARLVPAQSLAAGVAAQRAATAQETPLPPMPTPVSTLEAQADWLTYSSPYWGVSFRYPPKMEITGPESAISFPDTLTEEELIARIVGLPLFLSSPDAKGPSIVSILEPYTLSEQGDLAEWVLLKHELDGMMGMGSYPIQLYTVPDDLLPTGFDQGIYTVDERPYNPVQTLWLERDGFVYSFWSAHSQPEGIALINAVANTFTFDPAREERLRASEGFRGDEVAMGAMYEDMQPEPTPECDDSCREQQERVHQAIAWETAIALPAAERPVPQAVSPLPVSKSWHEYAQPTWGITFQHPPEWKVEDYLVQSNLKAKDAPATTIDLSYLNEETGRYERITFQLWPYLVSEETPLANWEVIQDQNYGGALGGLPYRIIVPVDPRSIPPQADDMVQRRIQTAAMQRDTFWISKDGVIFRIYLEEPSLLPLVTGILSTLEFDQAQLEELRAADIFEGNERQLVAKMVERWEQPTYTPTPTVDPAATATPTMTPVPPPTPSPTVHATPTPSVFDSPLANGLKRYRGTAVYNDMAPFEVQYDPGLWQLIVDGDGQNFLYHQEMPQCVIHLNGWASHVIPLAPVTLAGHTWSLSVFPTTAGDFLAYGLGWDNGAYTFNLALPTPIPDPYDADNKGPCEQAAEAVFDTFTVMDDGTPAPIFLPTVTPTRQG